MMKDKEIYKTVKQYEDGLITPVECLLNLFDILSEEMKVVKEIERFYKEDYSVDSAVYLLCY